MLVFVKEAVPIPPPAYHRVQARLGPALHIDALTLVNTLHLLTLCRLAVRLAHNRCSPPLPAGPGGAPRTYREESLLLIALVRTLWRLSYQDMRDWLRDWPALALACGLPLGRMAVPAFRVHRNSASVGSREARRYLKPFSCSACWPHSVVGSLGPVISSSIAFPSSLGVAQIPMLLSVMLQLNTPVRSYAATEFIR